jgi:hypothetical protein
MLQYIITNTFSRIYFFKLVMYSFRHISNWMALSMIMTISACALSTHHPATATLTSGSTAASSHVVATAWNADLVGRLIEADGCLQIINKQNNTVYTLAWPPDLAVTIEGNNVKILKGIVTGNREEILLNIGETIRMSGGVTENLSKQLQETVNENCMGPYWVVGFEIYRFQTTEVP